MRRGTATPTATLAAPDPWSPRDGSPPCRGQQSAVPGGYGGGWEEPSDTAALSPRTSQTRLLRVRAQRPPPRQGPARRSRRRPDNVTCRHHPWIPTRASPFALKGAIVQPPAPQGVRWTRRLPLPARPTFPIGNYNNVQQRRPDTPCP